MIKLQSYILNLSLETMKAKSKLEELLLKDADFINKKESVIVDNLFKSLVSTSVAIYDRDVDTSLNNLNNIDIHLAFPELNFIYLEDYNEFDIVAKNIITDILNQIKYFIPVTDKTELVLNHVGNSYLIVDLYGVSYGKF